MKVLIYKNEKDLAPVGGPNGYCYNIKKELDRIGNTDFCFLNDSCVSKHKTNSLIKYLSTFIRILKGNSKRINFKAFDAVHFHSTRDLYENRKNLKNFKGLVLLTMHSPIPFHMEMVENIKAHHKFLGCFLRKHAFSKIDKIAFNRATNIVLPCKEAEESYFTHWKKYKKIHNKNKDKYAYIPTGISKVQAKITPEQYRAELGYGKDDFIVSYVGRHNSVKGYDRIIEIAKFIDNKDIKFLVGGKEFPMSGPKLDNWKEIGWTNDPYSLIAASNVFILPNRETYFDIVLLEVLSLGKTCIISRTGGNKLILSKKCKNIFGFSSEKRCAELLLKLKEEKLDYTPNKNILEFFKNNYDISIFVKKYINFLKSEISNRKGPLNG